MDVSAIIYAALGGGIGGALGPLIGRLINNKDAKKGTVTVISAVFIAIGYQGTTLLYKNMTLPRIVPLDTSGVLKTVPALKYVQSESPKLYAKLIHPIDKAVRNNETTQETLNDFRLNFEIALSEKRKNASAKTLRTDNDMAFELYGILKVEAPVVCTQKLHGRPFQMLTEFLSKDYLEREQ